MILVVLAIAFAGCSKDDRGGGGVLLSGKLNGHRWVNLGLPSGTLWATCNLGADSPTAYGDYFAWGETRQQDDNAYSWASYKYANGISWNDTRLTKYCLDASYGDHGFTDTLTILLPEDDAATANWGSGWRTPTYTEIKELVDNCTIIWTTQDGVNGCLLTASNGNSLFLPAAGSYRDGDLSGVGGYGFYWSSSLCMHYTHRAWSISLGPGDCSESYFGRNEGFSVRPVCYVSW